MTDMAWIAPVYLKVLMDRAAANPEDPEDPALLNEALQYAEKALNGEIPAPEPKVAETALLDNPPGVYGRIELPGYRENTGWVSTEARFGIQAAVVRDRDGTVLAEVFPGPGSRFVRLPDPLEQAEAQGQLALPVGAGFGHEFDDDDEPGGWQPDPDDPEHPF